MIVPAGLCPPLPRSNHPKSPHPTPTSFHPHLPVAPPQNTVISLNFLPPPPPHLPPSLFSYFGKSHRLCESPVEEYGVFRVGRKVVRFLFFLKKSSYVAPPWPHSHFLPPGQNTLSFTASLSIPPQLPSTPSAHTIRMTHGLDQTIKPLCAPPIVFLLFPLPFSLRDSCFFFLSHRDKLS